MSNADSIRRVARFGPFEVDLQSGELHNQDAKVRLQRKSFEVLKLLLDHAGEVVDRDTLQRKLWPSQTFVDFEEGLNAAVWKLRLALCDSAERPKFIETLPRLGYRFVAPVSIDMPVGSTRAGPISVGVLPFGCEFENSDAEYLALGITDDVIASLAQVRELRVMGRSTMARFKEQRCDPQAIARELQLNVVVAGEVVPRAEDVSVSAEVVDAETGLLIWAQTYRKALPETAELPQAIAADVRNALQVRVSPVNQRQLAHRHSENSEAYQLYLRGRYQWSKRTEEGLKKALNFFNQALEIDPLYALAYAGLADAYTLLSATGYKESIQQDCMRKAKAAALRALEIDDSLAEPHASLAFVSFRLDWNWQEAERQFRAAIELNPNYVTAHHWFAIFLSAMGRIQEAFRQVQAAQELDPLSMIVNAAIGRVHYFARDYASALKIYQTALETEPQFAQLHLDLGMVFLQIDAPEKAIAEFQQAAALSGRSLTLALLGVAYAKAGRINDALTLVTGRAPDEQALIQTALIDKVSAVRSLTTAHEQHAGSLAYLKVEPLWDGLRGNMQFDDLLRKMGLIGA